MPELREVFEMVTKQVEPDQESWKEQEAAAALGAQAQDRRVSFGGRHRSRDRTVRRGRVERRKGRISAGDGGTQRAGSWRELHRRRNGRLRPRLSPSPLAPCTQMSRPTGARLHS